MFARVTFTGNKLSCDN